MAGPAYRHRHQQIREQWRPVVDAGQAYCTEPVCLMPSRWIAPGTPWHLAHDRANGGYHGPAHERCNTSEGAKWLAHLRKQASQSRRPARWAL